MIRLRDLAALRGVCKKTALRQAMREGKRVEKRPVRGGWAWFVDDQDASARAQHVGGSLDVNSLAVCIELAELAVQYGMRREKLPELAVRLYKWIV